MSQLEKSVPPGVTIRSETSKLIQQPFVLIPSCHCGECSGLQMVNDALLFMTPPFQSQSHYLLNPITGKNKYVSVHGSRSSPPEQIIDLEGLVALNKRNLWAKVKELIIFCHYKFIRVLDPTILRQLTFQAP